MGVLVSIVFHIIGFLIIYITYSISLISYIDINFLLHTPFTILSYFFVLLIISFSAIMGLVYGKMKQMKGGK